MEPPPFLPLARPTAPDRRADGQARPDRYPRCCKCQVILEPDGPEDLHILCDGCHHVTVIDPEYSAADLAPVRLIRPRVRLETK